ncbi:MAG: Crp/Fnr family transcriptional regulator [Syntrophobacteraceae bacterium]
MISAKELREIELFSSLSDAHLGQLAKITRKKKFKAGSCLYWQGEPAQKMYVINAGLVSLRKVRSGNELSMAFELRQRGDLLGVAYFTKPQKYTLTAVCLEDAEVFEIDADKLFLMCESDFELGYRIMKAIAQIYFERFESMKEELGFPVLEEVGGKAGKG